MRNIFENRDNFLIESCIIIAKIQKHFELVQYDINFTLKKISDGPATWDLISPISGFKFLYAKDSSGEDITDKISETTDGLKKIRFNLAKYINAQKIVSFKLSYITKIDSELLNNKFLSKSYGVIFTRSFGAFCKFLRLEISLDNKCYRISHVVPRFTFPNAKVFVFTDIPTQKPIPISLIANQKMKTVFLIVSFIVTALAGHYIPIVFELFIK